MKITSKVNFENEDVRSERYEVVDDSGKQMSHAGVTTQKTYYAGQLVSTMLLGGVGTAPIHRRSGCVRCMIEKLFGEAEERGWQVSMLHPFESLYYRKFGYERISDTIICDFPISVLGFLPRYSGLTPVDGEDKVGDLLVAYENFARTRNIFFKRRAIGDFPHPSNLAEFPHANGPQLYLDYSPSTGRPEGYLAIRGENHYDGINKNISDNLHVLEYGFANRESLVRILSFLRMFDGEFDTVRIHDIGMAPEVDMVLQCGMNQRYDLHPDVMARIFNTSWFLSANTYPQESGSFTLDVQDSLPTCGGVYHVEYGQGQAEVSRLPLGTKGDLTVNAPALARFLYGYDAYDVATAAFVEGVSVTDKAADFFRAFPKRHNGLFPHF